MNDLHKLGKKIYGNGLSDWVYIRILSRDMGIPESTVRRWWYDSLGQLGPNARQAIQNRLQKFMAGQPDQMATT